MPITMNAEAALGNLHTVFRMSKPEQDALKLDLLRQSFAIHYAANAFFRTQCEGAGVTPDSLQSFEELRCIPLIPLRTFKQANAHVLLSVPLTEINFEARSVGTSAIPSVARRDRTTTSRLAIGIIGLIREFFGFVGGAGLFLCPSPAETPEMGMVRLLNMFCCFLDDRVYLLRNYLFQPEEAIAYLESWADKQTRHIFGPPTLISRLLRHMEQADLRMTLDRGSFVITSGGWSRHTGETLAREAFHEKLNTYLGIRPEQCRDSYGMIESNMLAFECEHHRKHVSPWCHVSIRDLRDLAVEMPVGRTGVIAALDSISTAYPSFILTEDVGRIDQDGECPCGRVGQVITFNRRLKGAEVGCCAVSIERFMETQKIARECTLNPA